jgi:hypothetical protein
MQIRDSINQSVFCLPTFRSQTQESAGWGRSGSFPESLFELPHHSNNDGQQSFLVIYLILVAIPSLPSGPLSSDIEATSQTNTAGLTYSVLSYSQLETTMATQID